MRLSLVSRSFFITLTISHLALSGCASSSRVTEVRAEAADAQRTADLALSSAQQALNTAREANDRSYRTEEMLDRGFRRSMRK